MAIQKRLALLDVSCQMDLELFPGMGLDALSDDPDFVFDRRGRAQTILGLDQNRPYSLGSLNKLLH